MNPSMANWPPPMKMRSNLKSEINENFPILFFTFLLLMPQEVVLEREQTMADEEHFFLPTGRSEYACMGNAKIEKLKT